MCGIFLVFDSFSSHQKTKKQIETKLNLIFEKLKKRGPDYQDTWMWVFNDWFLYCGQTTLSITGKYEPSNFITKDRLFQILFNGQIYNFKKLNSEYDCDTQFLVNFLGKGLQSLPSSSENYRLERIAKFNQYLDGMFAYCLIDHRPEFSEIFLSRDIQGEKSLYYHHNTETGRLVISSEIAPIRDYLKIINQDYLYSPAKLQKYFMTRHFLSNDGETIYPNISQLIPGQTLQYSIKEKRIIDNKVIGIDSLINPSLFQENSKKSFQEVVQEFDDLFKEIATEMVPTNLDYACIVSGGIDSSLSAYYCSQVKTPKKMIAINSVGKDWISNDLSLHQEALKQPIETIQLDEETYSDFIKDVQEVYQSPVHTHSSVSMAILTKEIQKANVKVLITGEGADEYFGGYSTYLQELETQKDYYQTSPSNYSKEVVFDIEFSLRKEYQKEINKFRQTLKKYWKQSIDSYSFLDNNNKNNNNKNQKEILYQAMILCDAWIQLPNVGLRASDLTGLMNGVETRTFFTRRKLIKKILNCPLWMKLDFENQTTKLILRKLYLNYFPKESLLPKQGFSGFPNESKKYLPKYLELLSKNKSQKSKNKNNIPKSILDILEIEVYHYQRPLEWKIINCDYFINLIQ